MYKELDQKLDNLNDECCNLEENSKSMAHVEYPASALGKELLTVNGKNFRVKIFCVHVSWPPLTIILCYALNC